MLLAESAISAAVLLPIGLVFYGICDGVKAMDLYEDASLANLIATLRKPGAVPALLVFLLTAYGKDAGKFWLIKYTSALRQKVLALLFPVGTWAIGLMIYYVGGLHHTPALGVPWQDHKSLIELLGFSVIIAANVIIVLLKVKNSCVARCCRVTGCK